MSSDTTITDDDEGKPVVNANGDKIGIVAAVEGGEAHVDPDPGITDTIRSKLGWEDTSADTYSLPTDSIEEVTDDEIRLGQNV